MKSISYLLGLTFSVLSLGLVAQSPALYPRPSQKAEVRQQVGTTDITLNYCAPQVQGRKIFGGLVPFEEKINGTPHPWRAGANENTIISFAHPVSINGQALAAGTYGLHMFVAEKEWIIVFSKNAESWGSFSYKASEDALRVKVQPAKVAFQEWLSYQFIEPKADQVKLRMHWENTAVSFSIQTAVEKNIISDVEKMESPDWHALLAAADNILKLDSTNLKGAMEKVETSIGIEKTFENQMYKAKVLRLMGETAAAKSLVEETLQIGKANQIFSYAMALNNDKQDEEAMRILKFNEKQHPKGWFTYLGYGNYYRTHEDYKKAAKYYKKAAKLAPPRAEGFARVIYGQAQNKQMEQ